MRRDTLPSCLSEPIRNQLQQKFAINVHKIALDIQFEHIGFLSRLLAATAYVMLQTADAIVCAPPLDATIGVRNKRALEDDVRIIVVEMMNNTIPKVRSKNLSFLRVRDNKTGGRAGTVGALREFCGQQIDIFFQITLKILHIAGPSIQPTFADGARTGALACVSFLFSFSFSDLDGVRGMAATQSVY